MKSKQIPSKVSETFKNLVGHPDTDFTETEKAFHDLLISKLENNIILRTIITKDDEIDTEWITFFWWVFNGDNARINDLLHGYLWSIAGDTITPLNPTGSLAQNLVIDPVAHAERVKIKDYIKHINWIYHKTQNMPNIVIMGRENIPERYYNLRQSTITLLDPKRTFPEKLLFPDYLQRRRFHTLDSYSITDVLNPQGRKMLESQNVVIIDDHSITLDPHELEQAVIMAGELLTQHGRCLFDVPMYTMNMTRVGDIILPFAPKSTRYAAYSNVAVIDEYIHQAVRSINEDIEKRDKDFFFEIEELKLTDAGRDRSVAARVYLKKNYAD